MKQRIKPPAPVGAIYRAVEEFEAAYPLRKFTPDGHLVGSIGEVIAAEARSRRGRFEGPVYGAGDGATFQGAAD